MATRQITLILSDSAYEYLKFHIAKDQVAAGIFLTGLAGGIGKVLNAEDNHPGPIGTLPPRKEEQPQPPAPMTFVEALTIGQSAASFLLTGAPALSTFEIDKVDAARELLHSLAYDALEGTKQGKILRSVFMALYPIQSALRSGRTPYRARGPQKVNIQAALDVLPQLIDEARRGRGDGSYWRGFRDEALAELEDIFGKGEPDE